MCYYKKVSVVIYLSRLAFCMQNRSFRLYSNTAVVPQKVFDKVILYKVHHIIDAKWRTSEYLQILAKSAGQATVYKRKCVVYKVYVLGSHDKKLWKQISCYKMH